MQVFSEWMLEWSRRQEEEDLRKFEECLEELYAEAERRHKEELVAAMLEESPNST